jgi:hypothetical protein
MPQCELVIDDRGHKCGRRTDVERIMVRGPGFTIPEPRLVCGRCRGEERPPVVAPPPPPATRPPCPVCARRTASKTGVCYNCRMALVFHCRTYPERLPTEGTLSRQALEHIRPKWAARLKQGAIILRMRRQLDAL